MATANQALLEDDFAFADEQAPAIAPQESWKLLIVDDEPEVHAVTKLALSDFAFDGKQLEIHNAYSAQEARQLLAKDPGYALMLVDVVMETDTAGLDLVRYIRDELQNSRVRLVLRTGQPGVAPERFVIENYDIDDYRAKTELTAQKLFTTMVVSLRGYKEIMRIEKIVTQRTEELRHKNDELRKKNADLLDSITYARRIQEAILPIQPFVKANLPTFFVLYEPKDIVSGDFYWSINLSNEIVFAAIDCTGHGVPGAFMSVLAYSLLNQVVSSSEKMIPSHLLDELDKLLAFALQRDKAYAAATSDGMDIALCKLDITTLQLEFSGARRPLYLYRADGSSDVIPGTRVSIGSTEKMPFENNRLQLTPGDTCYIFTDGITDQFGGEKGRKFTSKRFRELLASIQPLELKAHYQKIKDELLTWKGKHDQTDDILVIGMRV